MSTAQIFDNNSWLVELPEILRVCRHSGAIPRSACDHLRMRSVVLNFMERRL